MTVLSVCNPDAFFLGLDGLPLDGTLWVGKPGQAPETSLVEIFSKASWNGTFEGKLPNPINIKNGVPINSNGDSTKIYINISAYSYSLKNKNGAIIKSSLYSNDCFVSSIGAYERKFVKVAVLDCLGTASQSYPANYSFVHDPSLSTQYDYVHNVYANYGPGMYKLERQVYGSFASQVYCTIFVTNDFDAEDVYSVGTNIDVNGGGAESYVFNSYGFKFGATYADKISRWNLYLYQ